MFDYDKIYNEVETYLDGWYRYYDVPEIMAELCEYTNENGECITTIDDVDTDDFTKILQRYDKTCDDYSNS